MIRSAVIFLLCFHIIWAAKNACDQPILKTNQDGLPDSSFTASSSLNVHHGPTEVRIANGDAWCADKNTNPPHILTIDLGSVRKVGRIATKGGRSTNPTYVRSYSVRYSRSGIVFTSIRDPFDHTLEMIFQGNVDRDTPVYHDLQYLGKPLQARYIQIVLIEFERLPCMRMELYECSEERRLRR